MSRDKTGHLNIRIAPWVKERLRELAQAERRSMAAMVEVLILERFGKEAGSSGDGQAQTRRRGHPL